MNEQKLPNSQAVFILGICSIVGSCCCSGIVGLICGIIGLVLYKKDNQLYQSNPEMYATSFTQLSNGRIMCIIGTIIGALGTAYLIFILATVGFSGYMEQIQSIINNAK